jgi:energy-converting hydrogenase B subunit D
MILLQLMLLALVAVSGTAVVFCREPACQAVGISFFGLMLAVMFMAFQVPDVALSQIVIGTVGLPLMILLCLAKLRRDAAQRERAKHNEGQSKAGA